MLKHLYGLNHRPVNRNLTGKVTFHPKPLTIVQLKAIRKRPRWFEFGKVAKGMIKYPTLIPSIVT